MKSKTIYWFTGSVIIYILLCFIFYGIQLFVYGLLKGNSVLDIIQSIIEMYGYTFTFGIFGLPFSLILGAIFGLVFYEYHFVMLKIAKKLSLGVVKVGSVFSVVFSLASAIVLLQTIYSMVNLWISPGGISVLSEPSYLIFMSVGLITLLLGAFFTAKILEKAIGKFYNPLFQSLL